MYQSTHTGAQVDAAVDKALSADSVPTPGSTNLVQSGGVYGVLSNRNILDNWFFANPVNQRGLTSYSGNDVYCIDRWRYYGTIPMTLQSDGIRLGDTTSNTVTVIRQFIDIPQKYAGKTLTFSVRVKDLAGTDGSKGFIRWYVNDVEQTASFITGELTTLTLTVPSSLARLFFDIGSYWNKAFTAVSAKLEIGSVSTLANDAPPNYGEEFERCATSRADSTDAYANQAPVSMRGFVPLLYTGTLPSSGGEVNQATFTGYNEYYLVDFQYGDANGYAYGLSASAFSASPFIQYAKNTPTTACRIRFTINSNAATNGRPYYVLLMAR